MRHLVSAYLEPFDELAKGIRLPKGATLAAWKLVGVLLALVPNLERLSIQVQDEGGFPPQPLRRCILLLVGEPQTSLA